MPVIEGMLGEVLANQYSNDVFYNLATRQPLFNSLMFLRGDGTKPEKTYSLEEALTQCVQTTDELLAEDV